MAGATGASGDDFLRGHWIDRARLAAEGAVIIETPESLARAPFSRLLPQAAGPMTELRLPYRRWRGSGEHVYLYRFVPPENCPPPR